MVCDNCKMIYDSDLQNCPNCMNQNNNVIPQKSKKKSNYISILFFMIFVIGIGIFVYFHFFLELENLSKDILNCYLNKESCLFEYIDYEESDYINKDIFPNISKNDVVEDIEIVNIHKDEGIVNYKYVLNEKLLNGRLEFNNDKKFLIFNNYSLDISSLDLFEEDYKIVTPVDSTVLLYDKVIDEKYKVSEDLLQKTYIIDKMFASNEIKIEYNLSGFDIITYTDKDNFNYKNETIQLENKEVITTDIVNIINIMYDGFIKKSLFESLEINEGLEEVYTNIYSNYDLSKFAVKSLENTTIKVIDNKITLKGKLSYDYTLLYLNYYTNNYEEKSSNSSINIEVELIKLEDEILINNISNLPNYFSRF